MKRLVLVLSCLAVLILSCQDAERPKRFAPHAQSAPPTGYMGMKYYCDRAKRKMQAYGIPGSARVKLNYYQTFNCEELPL